MMNTLSSVHLHHSRKVEKMQQYDTSHYIGEKVVRSPSFGSEKRQLEIKGVITYIHPSNKWYTVEFNKERGKYRESYFSEVQPYEENRD